MPFDPSAPFEVVTAEAQAFDPSRPFERVEEPSFDPGLPFERVKEVSPHGELSAGPDALQSAKRGALKTARETVPKSWGEAALLPMTIATAPLRLARDIYQGVRYGGEPVPDPEVVKLQAEEQAVRESRGVPGLYDRAVPPVTAEGIKALPEAAQGPAAVAGGVYNAARQVPRFFTTAPGVATLMSGGVLGAGPAALAANGGRAIAGGFAVDMASGLPAQMAQSRETLADPQAGTLAKVEAVVNPYLTAALVKATATHAFKGRGGAPAEPAPIPPELDNLPRPAEPATTDIRPQTSDLGPTATVAGSVVRGLRSEVIEPPRYDPLEGQPYEISSPETGPSRVESLELRVESPAEVPTATAIHPEMVATVEFPLAKLKLSKDVPNFKGGASEETSTVAGQELAGKYQRTGTAPIVAWQRLNGDTEVITGRHRLDLARRTGETTIPTQLVREADGFTKDMALTFDAEANIRDGQGEVADYATYFKGTPIPEAEARARGLLSRAKGKAGWSLAKAATDDVYALWRADKLTDAQAVAIANAAPGDAGAQQIGSKFALQGKGPDFLANVIKASQAEAGQRAESLDLFGKDDSAMKAMAEQAERASQFQRDLVEQIRAVQGAAKRPEAARKLGVDVRDPEGVVHRIAELKAELAQWENWPMQPDLVAKVRGGEAKPTFSLAPAESVAQQTARLAQEAAQREAKGAAQAQQDKLAELAAKPLAGTTGDLGQGDLLKAPEDLFAPPSPGDTLQETGTGYGSELNPDLRGREQRGDAARRQPDHPGVQPEQADLYLRHALRHRVSKAATLQLQRASSAAARKAELAADFPRTPEGGLDFKRAPVPLIDALFKAEQEHLDALRGYWREVDKSGVKYPGHASFLARIAEADFNHARAGVMRALASTGQHPEDVRLRNQLQGRWLEISGLNEEAARELLQMDALAVEERGVDVPGQIAKADIITRLEASRDRFGESGGIVGANPLPEAGRQIWRAGHNLAIDAIKAGRSAREAIEHAWQWMQDELTKAGIPFDAAQLKQELYDALNVRQQAQRFFEDTATPEPVKRDLQNVFFTPTSEEALKRDARAMVDKLAGPNGEMDRAHNLVAAKLEAGTSGPLDVAAQAELLNRYEVKARTGTPAEKEFALERMTDLMDAGLGKSTEASAYMNAMKLLAAHPVAGARHLKREFLGKVAKAWEEATTGHLDNLRDAVRNIVAETRERARRDPGIQAEAGKAVVDATMREASQPGSPLYSGIVLEASNSLEMLPSVMAKAREVVVKQWQRLGEKEFVRNIAQRSGQGIENAIWGAVQKAGGDRATVQKVMAQLNGALHEQLNSVLGVKKEQFANPQAYLQRLQSVLHNGEQLSRIWSATRESVGHNLAEIGRMRGLIERIDEDVKDLEAAKSEPFGLEDQRPEVRAEGRRLRDAQLDESIRQARMRQSDVRTQLAEYEKMAPAWRAVMGMTVDVWSGSLLRGALKEQMQLNQVNLRKLVADHFRGLSKVDPTQVLKTLAEKILDATGLDKPAAERLAKDLEREYVALVEKERALLRKRIAEDEARRKALVDRVKLSRSIVDRETEAAAKRLADAMSPGKPQPAPAIKEFYQRLTAQMRRMLPDIGEGGRKLSDLDVVREAITNPERYAEVWQRLGDELRSRHGIEGLGEVNQLLGEMTPGDFVASPMDRLIRARLAEKKQTFGKLIEDSGMAREQAGKDLAARLVSELGLTGEAAARFVAAFNRRWQFHLDNARAKVLDRLALDPKLDKAAKGELWKRLAEDANKGLLTDERFTQKLKTRYGVPEWTPEMGKEVLRRLVEIQGTPEGITRDFKTHSLYRWLKTQQGGTALDYAREMFYSNLFNSTTAWTRNAGFNAGLTAARLGVEAAANPRAFLDILRSGPAQWGATEGLRDAASIVGTGEVTGAKLSKFESARLLDTWRDSQNRIKRWAGTYFSIPGRMLAAGDVPFYRFWQEWEWAALARDQAIKEGKRGDDVRRAVADLLDYGEPTRAEAQAQAVREGLTPKPTEGSVREKLIARNEYWRRVDEIIQQQRQERFAATGWGELATETALFNTLNSSFSNTPLGRFGRFLAAQKAESGGPMWDAMLPVVKVIVNAADLGIEATPGLNWVRAYEVASSGGTRFRNADIKNPLAARRFAANFILSHAAVAALAALSASQEDAEKPLFKLHGRGPIDPNKRKQLPAGWQPHSFQVGGSYYNLGWLGPLILPLDIVGNYQDAVRYGEMDRKDALQRTAYALSQFPAVVLDQSGLQGFADALNFFSREPSEQKVTRTIGRIAKTVESVLVPGWLRQVDQMFDPQQYSPMDIQQAARAGIPWARRTDRPTLDWRGQPMERRPFDALKSEEKADPVGRDLLKLGVWVTKPAPKEFWRGVELTPVEQYEFTKRRQQEVYRLLSEWRQPDSPRHGYWLGLENAAAGKPVDVRKLPEHYTRADIIAAIRDDVKRDLPQRIMDKLTDAVGNKVKAEMKGARLRE